MATGASTANLAIILVDARHGVLPQSRRHAFIAAMLGIQHIVVAVNKMDLVGYSEQVFERIRGQFCDYAPQLQTPDLHFIPISALKGDNVVEKSTRMPWFDGSSLLHYLETVHIASDRNLTEMRFPVQYVIRPDLDFRGYAGQVASGVIRPGDPVMVLPSGRTSRVKSIVSYEGELPEAFPPMSVTVCLEDEIDISRGDMLVPPSHPPHVTKRIDARLVWMHEHDLELGRAYLLKHTTQSVRVTVKALRYRININTLEKEPGSGLGLNDIGAVVIETQKPLFCDPYKRNHVTGSFVLIDPMTNATAAAGMITGRNPADNAGAAGDEKFPESRVNRREREWRAGHPVMTFWLKAGPEAAYRVERLLFDSGYNVHAVNAGQGDAGVEGICLALNDAGVIVLAFTAGDEIFRERTRDIVGRDHFVALEFDSGSDVATIMERMRLCIEERSSLLK
jgi:sulfate adenylyltransferase large subunit